MDKQQAAKAYALNKYGDPKRLGEVFAGDTEDGIADHIAGWEAHEAQCSGDAVIHAIAFGEWIAENAKKFVMTMGEEHKRIFQMSIADKYKLFNPSGAAPQHEKSTKCQFCDGDGFIRTIAPMPGGTHQMDCPYCEARNDAMDEYKELPAPQPAGPVWVKASERLPAIAKTVFVKYKGENCTGFADELRRFYVHSYNCVELNEIEWRDDSAPQVFTREQAAKAYADGAIASQKRSAGEDFQTEQEYMDTNYPVK